MDNLIRTDTVFGKRVNIVGNISADLVLESLGKVYIKSRNKSLTLEEVIRSLAGEDPNISTSRVKVVEGIEGLDTTGLKDGTFIFDKLSSILYLFIDGELLELINVSPDGESYVKRSGDTMTGRLAIYVKNGPPLYVNSSTLVENLNAQYLNGETAETFTRRNKDEKIEGKWTFKNPTTFSANTLFYKDIIANGSVGSSSFAGGFGGYGWRMDASTNTLTIDNLVVRKLMQVYELVVNKISATNGSLWITNAGKVVFALKLEIKDSSFFTSGDAYERFCLTLKLGYYFIKLPGTTQTKTYTSKTASGDSTIEKTYWDSSTLENTKLIKALSTESYVGKDFSSDLDSSYRVTNLFSSDFKFNCTFPIVTRNDYRRYILNIESLNLDINSYITTIYSYYKYFAGGDFYVVAFDDDELPVFKPGDILRCLKWTYGGIKYYDAVVCNLVGNSYVILLAPSIYDNKTTITYDLSLDAHVIYGEDLPNLDLYKLSTLYREPAQADNINYDDDGNSYTLSYLDLLEKNLIGLVEEKDSLVLIGNLWDCQRQNAVYITSTDNGAPFMDVISGVNRPDYSVIYYIPIYKTVKLNACPIPTNPFNGYTGLVDVPYTGNYYIQKNANCEYIYFEYNNANYFASSAVPLPGNVNVLYYLNTYPDTNTAIGDAKESYNILTENGECIITEGSDNRPEEYIILEEEKTLLLVLSTKTTKARLGNLDGILDEIFPTDRLPYGYGLYGLNVFLTGEFYLNNGQSVADIGKDSISFAIASQNAIYSSMEILKQDLQKADNLLKQKVYTKGDLLSAGMRIGYDSDDNPGIVMWGNKIVMATTLSEFIGRSLPTALFANGRIAAKFISVNNIHSALGFGETIHIYLKEYTDDNDLKYYKEHQIFSRTDGNNNTAYYYVDDTGTEQTCENSLLMGNTLYGWNLEATGEGYLARGNISWEENGNLNIDGNIHLRKILLEDNGTDYNGIYVYGRDNLTALVINGQELNSLEDANSTSYFRLYIDWNRINNSTTTPLTIDNPIFLELNQQEQLAKLCEILFSGNKNINVTINIPLFTELTYIGPPQYINLAYQYPLIAAFYYVEENSTALVSCKYILNNEAFLSSGNVTTDAEYNYLVLYINPSLYGAMKGFIGVRTAILISLIGRNFMSITPNVDSLMWVGLDKFGVYYRRKTRVLGLYNAVLYGLEVDNDGIYICYRNASSGLAYKGTILNSIVSSNRHDLISYIDGGHDIVNANTAVILERFLKRNITVYGNLTVSGSFVLNPPQIGLIFTFIGATDVDLSFAGMIVLRSRITFNSMTLTESGLDEEVSNPYRLRTQGILRLMYIGTTQVEEDGRSINKPTYRIIYS